MLKVKEAAEIVSKRLGRNVPEKTIWNWVRLKWIDTRKVGGMRLILPSSLEIFLQKCSEVE